MRILLAEEEYQVEKSVTLASLAKLHKPGANVFILNGFPVSPDTRVREGDCVVLIQKGELPKREELEALLHSRHTPGIADRLKAATVGIAGLGGLGSAVALALARVGIGKLLLVDYDVVEPSNLNRQHYFIDQLGEAKTRALSRTLRQVNPFMELETHQTEVTRESALELFRDCEVVVEAFDRAEAKYMLIETLLEQAPETFVVAGSGMAGYGHSNELRVRQAGRLFVCGDEKREAKPGRGLMAPRVGIAAHLQANTVMEILLDHMGPQEEVKRSKGSKDSRDQGEKSC